MPKYRYIIEFYSDSDIEEEEIQFRVEDCIYDGVGINVSNLRVVKQEIFQSKSLDEMTKSELIAMMERWQEEGLDKMKDVKVKQAFRRASWEEMD